MGVDAEHGHVVGSRAEGTIVRGSSDGPNDSTAAVGAASRAAVQRARAGRGSAKKRSGSLALTAIIVVAVLGAMLWAMIALAP